jgi:hypothetical protein
MLLVPFTGISYAANKHDPPKAHKNTTAPLKLYKDTSNIQPRSFDANAIKHFKADKDFNYTDYAGAGETSWWENLWQWLWQHLFGWIGRTKYGGSIIEYTLLAGGIILIIYVVSKSLGIDPIQLLRGNSRSINLAYSESTEDINAIDFDVEIEKAISQNNYRLAVRLLYLRCLKQLSDVQLIHWQIDKTNSAYINELADLSQKQTFSLITTQFEYVWYGNFMIDKQAFNNISLLFQDFKQQLPS